MLFKKVKHFSTSKVFLSNILPYVNSEFGNYTRLADNNKFEMIDNLNLFILEKAKNYKFYFFDNCFLSSKFGLNGLEDLEKFYLARIPFKDCTNAFKMFSVNLKNKITLDSTTGFTFALELTAKSYFLNSKIIEIPSTWIEVENRKSNFKVLKWIPYYIYWLIYSILRNYTHFK